MSSGNDTDEEAQHQRFNYAGAAQQLHALQNQLSEYKSLLDEVQHVGEGTEELAKASERLAEKYDLIAEGLREEEWGLYSDAQQAKDTLQGTQDIAKQTKEEVEAVARQANATLEALEASKARLKQIPTVLDGHPIRDDLESIRDQIRALNKYLDQSQERWAQVAAAGEAIKETASAAELRSVKEELRRLREQSPEGESSALTDNLFSDPDASFWKRLGRRPEHRFWASCTAIAAVLIFGVFGVLSSPSSSRTMAEPILEQVQPEEVAVQVLNSVGKSGLASRTQRLLQEAGLSVPVIGNSPAGRSAQTIVFLHSPARKAAERVARQLQLDPGQIRPGPPSASGIDITVVLGSDFQALPEEVRTSPTSLE